MSENKQLITPKIPVECYEFIKRAAKTPIFFNHNHVIEVALRDLQTKIEGDAPIDRKDKEYNDTRDNNLSALCDLVKQHS